jgi:hypothetical protein
MRERATRPVARWTGLAIVVMLVAALATRVLDERSAHVPESLAGIRLESTLSHARSALAEPQPDARAGAGLRGRSRAFDEPATCTVGVDEAARVSAIDCELDPSPTARAVSERHERVLATVRQLYGKESRAVGGIWLWRNDRAGLSLSLGPDTTTIRLALGSNPLAPPSAPGDAR